MAVNTDDGTAPDLLPDPDSTLLINNSLIGVTELTISGTGNQVGDSATPIDPMLDSLADNGDDNAELNDEDGVLFGAISPGSGAGINIDLQNAAVAKVDAWIDFNQDGIWDSSEKILDNPSISSASVNDGGDTRSEITSIEVQFDAIIPVAPTDFLLTNTATGQDITGILVSGDNTGGSTLATLTFSDSPGVITGSNAGVLPTLADGEYELSYRPATSGNPADVIPIDRFFRKYGETHCNERIGRPCRLRRLQKCLR